MKRTRKNRGLAMLLFGALGAAMLGTACKNETKFEFDFNDNLVAELNKEYDPKIETDKKTSIISVNVYDEDGKAIELSDDYAFTPENIGNYYYVIVVETDGTKMEYRKTVVVKDTVAPTVVSMPTVVKTIELGVYSGFAEDLAAIEVDDNNTAAVAHVTKKAVAVTIGGKTETSETGFNDFLFKTAGEGTVKVEIKDVAGNTTYVDYKVNVTDTTAPVINVLPLNYAWLDENGQVTVPNANAQDVSGCTVNVTVKKGTSNVAVTGGKFSANVGDVFNVTYKVTDGYLNTSEKTVALKVLKKGQLIDATDANVSALFSTVSGVLESVGVLSYIDSNQSDTIEWLNDAYAFGSVKEYSGIQMTVTNYEYADVTFLLAAKVGGEKQYVGSAIVPARGATTTPTTFAIDLTKTGLDEIDGWTMEVKSGANLHFDFNAMQMTTFADPYVTVTAVEEYVKGSPLTYVVTQNGNEIYDGKVTLTCGGVSEEIGLNESYSFSKAGTYQAVFAFDLGNKVYTITKTLTVADNGTAIEVGKIFGGKVGKEYTVPTATAGVTLTAQVLAPDDTTVTLTNNKFTPSQQGTYTLNYQAAGATLASYEFYVEGKNQIAFETADAFDVSKKFNGGMVETQSGAYATAGKAAAKATIGARDNAGILWTNPVTLTGAVNYVTLDVYANLAGNFKVGLVIGDSLKVYTSREVTLNVGANKVTFVLGSSLDDKLENATIKGIILYNQSQYNNIYYIDNIEFTEKNSANETELFKIENERIYAQADGVVGIPNIIVGDSKLIKSQTVKIMSGSSELMSVVAGTSVTLTSISAGQYDIVYTIVAAGSNVTYKAEITLIVGAQQLFGELQLGDYYVNTPVNLPAPILTSDCYGDDDLENASVKKYYRADGGLSWVEANTAFTFDSTGYVDVKYTITVGDSKLSLYDQIYIHSEGVHLDFETWSGGANMGFVKNYNSSGAFVTMSEDWAYDGKYSARIGANFAYNDCAGIVYRSPEEDPIELGFEANAVVVWIYSEGERMENYFSVDCEGKWIDGPLKIKKGAHKYVIPLYAHGGTGPNLSEPRTVSSYKRITFEMWKGESFYIDNWSFVQIGDVEFPNVDGEQFNVVDGITFARPTAKNLSTLAFSAQEIAAASCEIQVTMGDSTEIYSYGTSESITLPLEKGSYKLTFVYKVGEYVFSSTQRITVRNFNIEFIEPRILFETGVAYRLDLAETPLENVTIKAYTRPFGAADWTELTIENGKANITLVGEGNYEIRFHATYGDYVEEEIYQVVIRAKNTVADFELNDDGTHVLNNGQVNERLGRVSDEWSYDGKYSYYVDSTGDDFTWINFTDKYNKTTPERYLQLDQSYNTITMWINANRVMTNFYLEIMCYNAEGKAKWYTSSSTTVGKGVAQYVFTFDQSFDHLFTIGWKAHYVNYTDFYVDTIRLYNVEFNKPNVPTKPVAANESIVFDEVTAVAAGLDVSVTVKAKGASDNVYTTLTAENGKYSVSFAKGGVAEIVVEIKLGDAVITYVYNVTVLDENYDPETDDIPWES